MVRAASIAISMKVPYNPIMETAALDAPEDPGFGDAMIFLLCSDSTGALQ
jgi:hypothetical protein